MKIPLSWLNAYVDVSGIPPGEIADKLTFSGIEVEGVETVGGDWTGVVAGEVRACRPHPNADRLTLCEVFDGRETVPVVCGAPNVKAGLKAAFAPAGTVLPNGMKLKSARIRGEISNGMLCAEDELGLSDDHAGILVLPPETPPGTPLADVLGPADTVFELEITWNRPDCLCVIGVARELAALFDRPLRLPETDAVEDETPVAEWVTVRVEDREGCPRYTARVLTDVRIAPSPDWMQRRLALCGVRPICNVVDVTNYVMLECGHPLHAFDYALLQDGQIVVRRARDGETMRTLDGVERTLDASMLVIADARDAVAVAGIMGGAGSEIRDTTATVLLESAAFDPRAIRRASSALGLATESSHRFERRVNPATVDWASNRAAGLMQAMAAGRPARGMVDVYPAPPAQRRVNLDLLHLERILGVAVPEARVRAILEALSLPVREQKKTLLSVEIPTFRPDLECEADLVEEVARLYGLEHIPDKPPVATVVPSADDTPARARFRCGEILAGLGFREILHYSFLSEDLLNEFNPADHANRVSLPNPVSADHGVLRHTLIPQMVECLTRNRARQIPAAALYEIGTVFFRDPDGHPREETRLAMGLMGRLDGNALKARDPIRDEDAFLALKGAVEQLTVALHAGELDFQPDEDPRFEPGTAVRVCRDHDAIGIMGLLRRERRLSRRLADPVALAEFRLDPMLCNVFRQRTLSPIGAYPPVVRDMAVVVDPSVRHDTIMKVIRNVAPPELTGVDLFDIFDGEGLGQGCKSLGYALTYQSREQTLTDEQVNALHEQIKETLRREIGVRFREG